jgi:methylmalonyl-CoA/ethylmalonyl-CoA epimerase
MIEGIEHIGIAVKSIKSAKEFFKKIGLEFSGEEVVEAEKVKISVCNLGNVKIELLEPLSEDSPIYMFVQKGGGIHHIGFKIKDIDNFLKESSNKGINLLYEKSKETRKGRKINFYFIRDFSRALLEFIEDKNL